MDLSIIIVNWNSIEYLVKCINSIINKTRGLSYEIIIVDNASSDNSSNILSKNYFFCKLILNKDNLGFAKANNQALAIAEGNFIVYLNPDTELMSNAFKGMVDFLNRNNEYGAISCKLINPGGIIQYDHAREFPTALNQLNSLLMLNRLFPKVRLFNSSNMEYWDHDSNRDIECLSGACIMLYSHLANKIGGFNESYYMYGEDVELCYRIKCEGWKLYYLSNEVIFHHAGASSDKRDRKDFSSILIRDTTFEFIKNNYSIEHALIFRLLVLIGSLFRIPLIIILMVFKKIIRTEKISIDIYTLKKYFNLVLWSLHVLKKHNIIAR